MADDNARYAVEMFPSNYPSWRYCIEVKCGLTLTPRFTQARIALLGDLRHEESIRFASLYGDTYREQVLAWFQRAADEA